jgi:cyclophilin family peptidyl-prolyl cis-trans isomerase
MWKYMIVAFVVVVGALAILFLIQNRGTLIDDQFMDISNDLTNPSSNDQANKITSPDAEQSVENKDNMTQKTSSATLHTNKGNITIEFFDTKTPKTVANFLKLAGEGFYDGTKFHRVIKGFMIQGGDPLTKDDSKKAEWGRGDPGYKFADEIGGDNKNDKGTISMANSGPNTNGSQFFINVADNNFLDDKHTVFGKVTSGMDIAGKIENTQTGPGDVPLEPVIIESITLK